MNFEEGAKRIVQIGIATFVTGVLAIIFAIALKNVPDMSTIMIYLFSLGVFMTGGGFVLGLVGYILRGFAKSR